MVEIIEHKIRVGWKEHEKFHRIGQVHEHEEDYHIVNVINPPATIPLTNYWLSCIMNIQTKPVKVYDLGFVKHLGCN